MKHLKYYAILFIGLLCALSIALLATKDKHQCIHEAEEIQEEEFISLNEILTNEESEIEECKKLDKYIERFLQKWEIKGAGLAVLKDEKLVYSKGYGWADEEIGQRTDVGHIFRIASLSKLITATAIMKMREDSLIRLSDKVFGEDGILNTPQFSNIKDRRAKNITVNHLLRHQGGFTIYRGDPLFCTRDIINRAHLDTVPDMDRVIEYCLSQRLGYTPGCGYCYSNLGYLILSKIIEVKSGMGYEEFCQKNVLNPAGCYDMHLAHNLYEDKYPNEVRYYETSDAEPILPYDNSDSLKYRRYGGNNIEGLYGAGGWVSSPCEYARFIAAIDRHDTVPDILKPESIDEMLSHDEHEKPIGWARASSDSDWMRTGTLAGTSAVAKCQKNGYIWVFITNTSSWKGARFTHYIDNMYRNAAVGIVWPERDLFQKASYK